MTGHFIGVFVHFLWKIILVNDMCLWYNVNESGVAHRFH